MSQQSLNLQRAKIPRLVPSYENAVETMLFSDEQQFNDWFETAACHHAEWVKKRQYVGKNVMIEGAWEFNSTHYSKTYCLKCDHAGKAAPRSVVKRQRTTRNVNCPALLNVFYLLNENVKAVYHWERENHDPTSSAEGISKSKLSLGVPADTCDEVNPIQLLQESTGL